MKLSFQAYVEAVKWYWNTLVDGIMIGIDLIKKGWYNFKNAIGMGEQSENNAAIARINASIEQRQKAITDGAKKIMELQKKANESLKWELSWKSDEEEEKDKKTAKNGKGSLVSGVGTTQTPNGNTVLGKQVAKVTGDATKSRNISITIGAFNKGDIIVNDEKNKGITLDQVEEHFTLSLLALFNKYPPPYAII